MIPTGDPSHYKGLDIVAVAHRLNTVKDADRIVVLQSGAVEHGTHDELVRRGDVYQALFERQFALGLWKLSPTRTRPKFSSPELDLALMHDGMHG